MIEKILLEKDFDNDYDVVFVLSSALEQKQDQALGARKRKQGKKNSSIYGLGAFDAPVPIPSHFTVFSKEKFFYDQLAPYFKERNYEARELEIFSIFSEDRFRQIVFITIAIDSHQSATAGKSSFSVHDFHEKLRTGIAMAISSLKKAKRVAIDCSKLGLLASEAKSSEENILSCIVEGMLLGDYTFDRYRNARKTKKHRVSMIGVGVESALWEKTLSESQLIAEASMVARDLENEPPNILGVGEFHKRVKKLSKKAKFKVQALDFKQLQKQGFGGIVAVNSGAAERAKLLILEHRPAAFKKTVLFVGKGVIFDSGGLSLKPSKGMEEMKLDMSGAAVVFSALYAAAALKLPICVQALIPLTENLISSKAYRVSDVLSMYGGKTVEVLNTDAEGRLILADSLAYASKKFDPDYTIDVATLTGACVVALGSHYAGLWSNSDELAKLLLKSSERSAEKIWRMPLDDVYLEEMKSKIADLRNIGTSPYGGAITAAKFLQQFVGKSAWAHLDIAGVMSHSRDRGYKKAGASGFGVRLLVSFLRLLVEKTNAK